MNTYDDIWLGVLKELRKEFSDIKVNSWFSDIKIVDIESQYAVLMTPTAATLDFVRNETRVLERLLHKVLCEFKVIYIYAQDRDLKNLKQIKKDIEYDLENPGGTDDDVYLRPSPRESVGEPKTGGLPLMAQGQGSEVKFFATGEKEQPVEETTEESQLSAKINLKTQINNDYTFDNYIVGSSNRFVYNACYAVATNPFTAWNPLFVYGPSGLGKTHLLYAITNELLTRNPDLKIIYVKGEEFTNQLVESLRTKNGPVIFRNKYRTIDVLLVDDIQFIAGKESVQEEFFHTFNALYEEHKQIILASDKPPREIQTLQDRLQNRFEMGLMADIQPPDYELRAAIIKSKAESYHMDIPNDVVTLLAENLSRNIRQIEGSLKKIAATSALYGIPITYDMTKKAIADMMNLDVSPQVITDRIFKTVAKKMGVDENEIKSKSKRKEITSARHIVIFLIRKYTPYSLKQIGALFGRDHSTIMNSIDVVETKIKSEPLFEREIEEIENEIKM